MRESARNYIIAEWKRVVNFCCGGIGVINIEIVNWRSYVARGDIKNISWFKLSSDISKDKKLFGLSPGQKWVFVVILCEACKDNNGGSVSFTDECLLFLTGLNKKDLQATLQHFKTVGLIDMPEKFSSPIEQDAEKVLPVDNFCNTQTRLDQTRLDETRLDKTQSRQEHIVCPSAPVVTDLSDFEIGIARDWLDLALTEHPHRKDSASFTVERFGQDLRKAQRALSLTDQQMTDLFEFVKHSAFWRPNAAVPSGLLKTGNNGLRKIDNIIASMKPRERRESEILNEQIAKGQFKKASNPLDEKILKELGLI